MKRIRFWSTAAIAAMFGAATASSDEAQEASNAGPVAAVPAVLKAAAFRHYIEAFNQNDRQLCAQHIPNAAAWDFLQNNIPLLDCPDQDIEEIYYFRWWSFRKHIKHTPAGFVITEFLPPIP